MIPDKFEEYSTLPDISENDQDGWLITFADMMTLLFAFFVLIVAISQVDILKFQRVARSMQSSVGNQRISDEQIYSLDEIYNKLQEIIRNENMTEQAEVSYSTTGIIMRFKGNVLFPSGSATLSSATFSILSKIADEIIELPYNIAVEGHTDNRPISTSQFPSNWELSAARATRVVRYFIEEDVNPAKVRAVGRADTKPLVANMDEDGNPVPENQARNRRVEVIFLTNGIAE